MTNDNQKENNNDNRPANAEDESKTFDMYHVKHRLDLALLIAFVVVVLFLVFYFLLSGGETGA